MSDRPSDFDCGCERWQRATIPADVTAAYCPDCLGWLKRPTKAGTVSEDTRLDEFARRGIVVAEPSTQEPIFKAGRPRQKSCSKDHPKWAWTKGHNGYGRCKLCERDRRRKADVKAAQASA